MNSALKQALDDWYDRMISERKDVPNNRLYHYTTVESFTSILASNQFWMTSYKYLGDPTEFVYSDKVIVENLERRKSAFEPKEYTILRQYLGYDIGLSPDVSPFVFSLSEHCDSLYQWRAYTDDGNGISIGIEPPEDGNRYYRNLSKVIYDPAVQDTVMMRIVDDYLELRSGYQDDNLDASSSVFSLYQALMHMRVRFKHPAYEIEKEWRYANYPGKTFSRYRWDRRGLVEYFAEGSIRDTNALLPIREICLGARLDEQFGRNAVNTLLLQHGYDPERIEVKTSEVPLR